MALNKLDENACKTKHGAGGGQVTYSDIPAGARRITPPLCGVCGKELTAVDKSSDGLLDDGGIASRMANILSSQRNAHGRARNRQKRFSAAVGTENGGGKNKRTREQEDI